MYTPLEFKASFLTKFRLKLPTHTTRSHIWDTFKSCYSDQEIILMHDFNPQHCNTINITQKWRNNTKKTWKVYMKPAAEHNVTKIKPSAIYGGSTQYQLSFTCSPLKSLSRLWNVGTTVPTFLIGNFAHLTQDAATLPGTFS